MTRGFDYYDALGLTRNASDVDIKRAYRKLSLKYHPDTDTTEAARDEFCRVSESYDVLSDPKKKGLYDLYGEEALKQGVPDGKGELRGGDYRFDAEFTPIEVFKRFFGTNNPFEALNVIAAQFEALTTKEKSKTGKNQEHDMELTLEEIYHGCSKKVTHTRKVLYESGRIQEEERTLVIDAKPGLPDGTRFVFEGEGNRTPTKKPGAVVFILKAKPHDRFVRKGADLLHKVVLPLYQSLVGAAVAVKTLDGRSLAIPLTEIITPGYKLTVPGEGLPRPTGGKGNLTLEIELLFPTSICEKQRMLLRSAFFLPASLTPEQAKAIKAFEGAFKDQLHGWATGFAKDEQ